MRSGRALRLSLGRNRVHLGSVDEIDAGSDCAVHLGVALDLGVLLAKRHRAEADRGYLDPGPPQLAHLDHREAFSMSCAGPYRIRPPVTMRVSSRILSAASGYGCR